MREGGEGGGASRPLPLATPGRARSPAPRRDGTGQPSPAAADGFGRGGRSLPADPRAGPSPRAPSHPPTHPSPPPPFLPRPGSNGTEPFPQPPAPGRALTKPHNAPRRAGTGGSRQPLAPSGEVWLVCARRKGLGFLALAWEKGARGQPPGAGRWAEALFSGSRA